MLALPNFCYRRNPNERTARGAGLATAATGSQKVGRSPRSATGAPLGPSRLQGLLSDVQRRRPGAAPGL